MTIQAFINTYARYAQPAQQAGIFPAVSLAAAYLESNRAGGISLLAERYNNFHGIQKYPKWKGKTVKLKDNQAGDYREFCVYPSVQAGFNGFVNFLKENPRYTRAGVFQAQTPKEQIQRIGAAGYSETKTWSETAAKMIQAAAATVQKPQVLTGMIILAAAVLLFHKQISRIFTRR